MNKIIFVFVGILFSIQSFALSAKVLKKEHVIYPKVIHWYTQRRLKLVNNLIVTLDGKII